MKTLIILTLIFGINSCNAQSEIENKLIGKWILVKETSSLGDDLETLPIGGTDSNSASDKKVESNTTLIFNKNKTIFINQMGNEYNSTYKLTDSILTIGYREYILVKIQKNELIFKDKNGLFDEHYKYKRMK